MGDDDADSSAVHTLGEASVLRRSMVGGRWTSTLHTLASGDNMEQIVALGELSTFLSYANEDSMLGFPSWPYMKVLMHIIGSPNVKYSAVKGDIREEVNTEASRHLRSTLPFQKILRSMCRGRFPHPGIDITAEGGPMSESADHDDDSSSDEDEHFPHLDSPSLTDTIMATPEHADDPISEDVSLNKSVTAATCLNLLLDILPRASNFFVSHSNELAVLQRTLQDIEYVDLAERVLLIYEKLVKEIPVTVVKSGSLISMLRYLEFFALDVQIGTLNSVHTAIKRIERGESVRNYLIPLVPFIAQALESGSKKIVQITCGIWKTTISIVIRAAYRSESQASEVIGTLVRSVVESKAVLHMCDLMFNDDDKLSRENVNQCLYSLAIITNESNDVLSKLFAKDVPIHVQRWLGHSGEFMLLRLVDLGLGMLGSYHTIEPLVTDCNKLYQRADYFSGRPDELSVIIDTFPMSLLMDIFDGTISQQLRKRVLLLVVRLLEMAGEVEPCRDKLTASIPLSKLVEAVCYTLRYNGRDESTEVAVHVITCLVRLLDRTVIGNILSRHGVSCLLAPLKSSKLQHEVSYILDSLPELPVALSMRSGYELIKEIKSHGGNLTMHELIQKGILDVDYDHLLSNESIKRLIRTILYEESGIEQLSMCNVDFRGITALWTAFMSILESQPEFTFSLGKEDVTDDESGNNATSLTLPVLTTSQSRNDGTDRHDSSHLNETLVDTGASNMQCDTDASGFTPDPPEGSARSASRHNDGCSIHTGLAKHAPESTSIDMGSGSSSTSAKQRHNGQTGAMQVTWSNDPISVEGEASPEKSGDTPCGQSAPTSNAVSADTPMSSSNVSEDVLGQKVRALLQDSVLTEEEVLGPVSVLCGLYEDSTPEASHSKTKHKSTSGSTGAATTSVSSKSRSRRADSRSRKPSDKPTKLRHRLRGALGIMDHFSQEDSIPFPYSNISHEIKLKLHCMDSEDAGAKPPSFTIYIQPLVLLSKIETYVFNYLNHRAQDNSRNAPSSQKKKGKTAEETLVELDPTFISVQIFYKGVPLAPTISLYRALLKLGNGTVGSNIWQGSHHMQYRIVRSTHCPVLHHLKAGRNSPLMAEICEERHSPLALFLGVCTFVNGWDTSVVDSMLTKISQRMDALENPQSEELRKIFDEVFSAHSKTSSCCKYEPDGHSSSESTLEASKQEHGVEDISHCCASGHSRQHKETDAYIVYLAKRTVQCLNGMNDIINFKENNDVLVTATLNSEEPYDLREESRKQLYMLVVLQTLFTEMNIFSSSSELQLPFSKRLTLKLLTLLGTIEESLCYQTPTWLVHLVTICPSLFSFDSRRLLFEVLGTGPHRFLSLFHGRLCAIADAGSATSKDHDAHAMDALDEILRQKHTLLRSIKADALQEVEAFMHVPKLKATCSRSDIVKDATLIMDQFVRTTMDSSALPRLEIEFENEVGMGSGPTQEFYSLVIESILKGDASGFSPLEEMNGFVYPRVMPPSSIVLDDFALDMFRRASKGTAEYDDDGQSAVVTAPSVPHTPTISTFRTFKLLGQLMAMALIDQKLLNLRLHPLFWRLCQNPSTVPNCSLSALSSVDPDMATSLKNLEHSEDLDKADLFFTYNDVPLVSGGDKIIVTRDNVGQYIKSVIKMRMYDGIRLAVWSFRMGFATIAPLSCLSLFTPMELANQMFSTLDQDNFWTTDHLQTYILPDHGYESSSFAYRSLITTLSQFSESERRGFLRFCTGAPVLPKQGFAGLRPLMRVVKKGDNLNELPSVMTCSNYLKLPDYSSADQLRLKLLHAIHDGQGSFNLS
ncbi:ubiquitin HECT domain containing protein [Babesia ovis]|uniref:Ubiquitin HECT domain containing protein n=1 Tax=Babesia ovis TaxID=5869 RepID=A0A9W5TCS3_BABOV|nr:ubiquitin HECT domain containing protein [Babesia ovis]